MIRYIIALLYLFGLSFGADNTESNIQAILDNKKIPAKVVQTQDLGHNLRSIIVEHTQNKERVMLFSTSDGAVLFDIGELIWSNDNAFLTKLTQNKSQFEKEQKAKIDSKVLKLFETYQAQSLTFKAKKPTNNTLYIISDPMCPYCLKELDNLPSRLESANVVMLIVGFLSEDSLKKASEILTQKSSDESKNLALLKKVYGQNYKAKDSQNPKVLEISKAAAQAGVHSVPYMVESKK